MTANKRPDRRTVLRQHEVAELVNMAVDCYHEVSEGHGVNHCDCFAHALVDSLVKRGMLADSDSLDMPSTALH